MLWALLILNYLLCMQKYSRQEKLSDFRRVWRYSHLGKMVVLILLTTSVHLGEGCGTKGNGQGVGKGDQHWQIRNIPPFQGLPWTQPLEKCSIITLVAQMAQCTCNFDPRSWSSRRTMRLLIASRTLEEGKFEAFRLASFFFSKFCHHRRRS